jgi:hypothetical protein
MPLKCATPSKRRRQGRPRVPKRLAGAVALLPEAVHRSDGTALGLHNLGTVMETGPARRIPEKPQNQSVGYPGYRDTFPKS